MKIAITVDLDNYREYERLLGSGGSSGTHSFYEDALPRFLDLFDRCGVRATFFAVGRDGAVASQRKRMREIAERGHELGNHSFTHPYNFRALSRVEKEAEIAQAEAAIADAIGERPRGFRTPSCDVDLETLHLLAERGYAYDSSVFPSPLMWVFMLYGKLFVKHETYQLGAPIAALAPPGPYHPSGSALHRRRRPGDRAAPDILEIPFSVTPWLRVPFYSTLLRRLGPGVFDRLRRGYPRSRPLLHAVFHLIELAEFEHTGLGRDYRRTPGLAVSLERRERFIGHAAESLGSLGECVPLGEFAASLAAGEAGPVA